MDSVGYLYVLREREFIQANVPVFKIGRTGNIHARFKQYPKGSELLWCQVVDDPVEAEAQLKQACDRRMTNRRDIGREYYEGPLPTLLRIASDVAMWHVLTKTDTMPASEEQTGDTPGELDEDRADPMRMFIELAEREGWMQRCKVGDGEIAVEDFRAAFHAYMNHVSPEYVRWKRRSIGDAVARNGITYRRSSGRTYYQGIRRCCASVDERVIEYAASA